MSGPLDAAGRRLDDPDFTGARLHGPVFEGARLTDAILVDAVIEGDVTGLVINGVAVEPLVRAERERTIPGLAALRAGDPAGLAAAWAMVRGDWAGTIARARALAPADLDERVDGEWSFVETQRHLVMATDIWHRRMILGDPAPYHPWGMAGSFLADPAALGLDYAARPSLDEVLRVREGRLDGVEATVDALTAAELARVCVPPAPGHPSSPHTVLECLRVILDEEFEHRRYAERDLALLEARPGA